jgi:D-glycerate 3-kinase
MQLAQLVFTALEEGAEVQIPKYDKSAHNGAGDRLPTSFWPTFNAPTQRKVQVVILEGWCVGFRNLPEASLVAKYTSHSVTLHKHRLEDLKFINERLKQYDIITDLFDAFIHIDAEDLMYVYEWRLEQEHALWKEKGTGMSDELVKEFVDGYFPAYELYTDELRNGWPPKKVDWANLRLVIGKDRKVKNAITRVKGT